MIVELPLDKLPNILPLLEERIVECNLTGRITMEYAKAILHLNMRNGSMAVFTDDVDKPTALLVLNIGTLSIFSEKVCLINVLHVLKSVRDDVPARSLRLGKDLIRQAKLYATQKKADCLRTSEWVWGGCDTGIGSLYKSEGLELQSHEFVLMLTTPKS